MEALSPSSGDHDPVTFCGFCFLMVILPISGDLTMLHKHGIVCGSTGLTGWGMFWFGAGITSDV